MKVSKSHLERMRVPCRIIKLITNEEKISIL